MEIYLFDFDDTLFVTQSKIYVISPTSGKIEKSFTTDEYRTHHETIQFYMSNGYNIDYSETAKKKSLQTAVPNKKYKHFLRNLARKGKTLGILTSRGVHPIYIQRCVSKHFKIKIPLENIICVHHEQTYKRICQRVKLHDYRFTPSENRKKNGLAYFIGKGYHVIHFFDDDDTNIRTGLEIQRECRERHFSTQIFTYLVRHSKTNIHK